MRFLDFVGIQAAAGLEDDVFDVRCDKELAIGAVGAIAGVKPTRH